MHTVYRARRPAALFLCLALLVSLLAGCATGSQDRDQQQNFNAFTHRLTQQSLAADKMSEHFILLDPEARGYTSGPATWGSVGRDSWEQAADQSAEQLKELRAFKREALTESQQLVYDVLEDYLQVQADYAGLALYYEYCSPNGLVNQIPLLLSEYALQDSGDVEDYLALLGDMPRYFGEILLFEQQKAVAGTFMTTAQLDAALEALTTNVRDPQQNALITTFSQRLEAIPDTDEQQRQQYTQRNSSLVLEQVVPAYQTLIQGLEALRPSCSQHAGLGATKQGKAYYQNLVKEKTGYYGRLDELEDLVDRAIAKEMQAMAGTDENTIERAFALTLPEMAPQQMLEDLQEKTASSFPPLSGVDCRVKELPTDSAIPNPALYIIPPIDGSGANVVYVNPNLESSDPVADYTTIAHEGYPGHLYQTNMEMRARTDDVRAFTSFNGYSEGWATYVEYGYGYQYLPTDDKEATALLAHNSFASLLLYCKADIMAHSGDYSEQEVIASLATVFGDDGAQAVYQQVADDPGTYLSYGVGALLIRQLYQQAQKELGKKFDESAFHQMFASLGGCSYEVQKKQVASFIESQK
ncbi:Bacterial protein of uncharacterised function (DUF885) [Anaerotruncus sp. 2789STDY5834896]|uniref:Bacterial protein of uncharacterized function (DUF885) n=1 Tax=uncultured Anaerotruncus sp. TaxID=905011 RepID=A0A1C6HBI2_9FIRM|nr:Bacterial protein of uncharacterised function (DUF885) [uncultured Anaerotruncus sp.]